MKHKYGGYRATISREVPNVLGHIDYYWNTGVYFKCELCDEWIPQEKMDDECPEQYDLDDEQYWR